MSFTLHGNKCCNTFYLGELANRLNRFSAGNTVPYSDLSDIIIYNKMESDVYELQFSPRIIDLFHSRMLVGQLSNMDQIISIQTSFHDENGNIILDNFGKPVQYTSYRQDLGHVLEILYPKFMFSYVKCRFSLQPNSNF